MDISKDSKMQLEINPYFPTLKPFEIGKKEETLILSKGKYAQREEVQEAIARNHTNDDVIKRIWGDNKYINNFLAVYPNLRPLTLDYGFITHLPEFYVMCEKLDVSDMNFKQVRNALKEELGFKIVYRAMGISDEQLESILNRTGMESNFLRYLHDYNNISNEYLEKNYLKNFNSLLREHICYKTLNSPLISVSYHSEVSIATANRFMEKNNDPKQIILFELEIPKIDIIQYADHTYKQPNNLSGKPIGITKIEGVYKKYYDLKEVESFVTNKINKEEIKSAKVIYLTKPALYYINME